MASTSWNWKAKDGADGGLLYEPGNWGDLLKLLWLTLVLRWKSRSGVDVNYFDPFAGDVTYPLGSRARFRFGQAELPELDYIRQPFIDRGVWPSSAAVAGLLIGGSVSLFDADPGRLARWRAEDGGAVLDGESGWDILAGRPSDPAGVWLIDPYDFLSGWRERIDAVIDKARATTILVYVYNRSARSGEVFGEYRAFRNALEDRRDGLPKRIGRVAADPFLPRAHHEMLFLPGRDDAGRDGFGELVAGLARSAAALAAAVDRAAAFDG